MRNAGAALSAVLGSAAVGVSKTPAVSRVGSLGDADRIRRLQQVYEYRLDKGLYEDVVAMFADDAEVVYDGGCFRGKEGIRRLYCDHFALNQTGKKIEPAPGFESDPAQQPHTVEVAEDLGTATGQFPYSIRVGEPMTGESSLVDMARLQGEGIVKSWEGGTCVASYIKVGESWKIRRLEYRAASKADYRPGRFGSVKGATD
jgi:hypothetical protein